MTTAFIAAVVAIKLCSNPAPETAPGAAEPFAETALSHETLFAPAPHPLRYDSGMRPQLAIPAASIASKHDATIRNPLLTAPAPKPKTVETSRGAIGSFAENVEALVHRYEEAELRPVSMGDGGGIEYRMKFGAKER